MIAVVAVGGAIARARRPATRIALVASPVVRGELRVTISATGTIAALTTVDVGAEVSGRILEVHADYNDHVTRGQLLAVIDPEQLRAALDQANAQLVASVAAVGQARATDVQNRAIAVRTKALFDQQLVSGQQLEQAQADAARATSGLANAEATATLSRAAVVAARSHLDKSKITSPIDGIVLAREVQAGQTLTAGFTTPVLFKLAQDLREMTLHVDVDEADVGRAREGNEASFTVDAYPDRVFASRVLSLRNDPKSSQNVVTYEAVLAVDNRELLLRPGMTATATILTQRLVEATLVPSAALRFVPPGAIAPIARPGWKTVWVRGPLGAPNAVAVRIGGSDGNQTQIVEGAIAIGAEVLIDTQDEP